MEAFIFRERHDVKHRRTFAFVVMGEVVALGASQCSTKDEFKKKIGRDIATGRAFHTMAKGPERRLLSDFGIEVGARKSVMVDKFMDWLVSKRGLRYKPVPVVNMKDVFEPLIPSKIPLTGPRAIAPLPGENLQP